jgi:hypothetical protein
MIGATFQSLLSENEKLKQEKKNAQCTSQSTQ